MLFDKLRHVWLGCSDLVSVHLAGNCSTYHCYKGGPEEPPLGQETGGCPLYSHPAQLTDNRNCVLCMECDKVPALTHYLFAPSKEISCGSLKQGCSLEPLFQDPLVRSSASLSKPWCAQALAAGFICWVAVTYCLLVSDVIIVNGRV
jgi:hypothetical protein